MPKFVSPVVLTSVSNTAGDVLTIDGSGVVRKRTTANILSDIGAAAASHTHTAASIDSEVALDGQVLTADGSGDASWEFVDAWSLLIQEEPPEDTSALWIDLTDNAGVTLVEMLDDLGDVVVTAPSLGQALVYDGSDWVNDKVVGVNASESSIKFGFSANGSKYAVFASNQILRIRPFTKAGGGTVVISKSTDGGNNWTTITNEYSVLFEVGHVMRVTLSNIDGYFAAAFLILNASAGYDDIYMNPGGNGNYYVPILRRQTLSITNVVEAGTGTISFSRSVDGGVSFSAISTDTEFLPGQVLRVEIADLVGWYAFAIPSDVGSVVIPNGGLDIPLTPVVGDFSTSGMNVFDDDSLIGLLRVQEAVYKNDMLSNIYDEATSSNIDINMKMRGVWLRGTSPDEQVDAEDVSRFIGIGYMNDVPIFGDDASGYYGYNFWPPTITDISRAGKYSYNNVFEAAQTISGSYGAFMVGEMASLFFDGARPDTPTEPYPLIFLGTRRQVDWGGGEIDMMDTGLYSHEPGHLSVGVEYAYSSYLEDATEGIIESHLLSVDMSVSRMMLVTKKALNADEVVTNSGLVAQGLQGHGPVLFRLENNVNTYTVGATNSLVVGKEAVWSGAAYSGYISPTLESSYDTYLTLPTRGYTPATGSDSDFITRKFFGFTWATGKFTTTNPNTVYIADGDMPRVGHAWLIIEGNNDGGGLFQYYRSGTYNTASSSVSYGNVSFGGTSEPGSGTYRIWVENNTAGARLALKAYNTTGRKFTIYFFPSRNS